MPRLPSNSNSESKSMKKGLSATLSMKHTLQLFSSGGRPKVRCHRYPTPPNPIPRPSVTCQFNTYIRTYHTGKHASKHTDLPQLDIHPRPNALPCLVAHFEGRHRLFDVGLLAGAPAIFRWTRSHVPLASRRSRVQVSGMMFGLRVDSSESQVQERGEERSGAERSGEEGRGEERRGEERSWLQNILD